MANNVDWIERFGFLDYIVFENVALSLTEHNEFDKALEVAQKIQETYPKSKN